MKQQIRNVKIPDMEDKTKWIKTDVTVENDTIVGIDKGHERDKYYGGNGLILSPGFVDIHMHGEGFTGDDESFDIGECMLRMEVTAAMRGNCGSEKTELCQFLDHIDHEGSSTNHCLAAGYNSTRKGHGALDQDKSFKDQIRKIQENLLEFVRDGAFATALDTEYNPNMDIDEILEALEPFKGRQDTFVAAHSRFDGDRAIKGLVEMIEVARRSDILFQISHLSSCCAYGRIKNCLNTIEGRLNQGTDLLVDTYPYGAFFTQIGTSVFQGDFLKKWNASYEDIILTEEPYRPYKLNEEIFKKAREERLDMLVVARVVKEDETKKSLKEPHVMVANDGLYNNGKGHPRGAGTLPRALGTYVREGVLSSKEASYRPTLQPAKRLGLGHKLGRIKSGYQVDLVLFDPEEIKNCADLEDSQRPPSGIRQVWANG